MLQRLQDELLTMRRTVHVLRKEVLVLRLAQHTEAREWPALKPLLRELLDLPPEKHHPAQDFDRMIRNNLDPPTVLQELRRGVPVGPDTWRVIQDAARELGFESWDEAVRCEAGPDVMTEAIIAAGALKL